MSRYAHTYFLLLDPIHPRSLHFQGQGSRRCSAINALIWDRSAKEEYDSKLAAALQKHYTTLMFAAVVAALGNSGWDWDGLEPYYQKAET